jgi:beta-glucosidase
VATYRELVDQAGVPSGYLPKQKPGLCSVVDGLLSCLQPAKPGPLAPLD